jgi:rsbT co-antagonist protein RsbR
VSDIKPSIIPSILTSEQESLMDEWLAAQANSGIRREELGESGELRRRSAELLRMMARVSGSEGVENLNGSGWREVQDLIGQLSRSRALQGASATETATFVLALKKPLFDKLGVRLAGDAAALAREVWLATALLDRLALHTTEAYQRAREEVIARQQQELLELSTPVVKLWDGILALPLIGTLDSARTQVVMESLLQMIVDTGAEVAIIDITGVPTVDTLVAQHLLKTVTAARLMGADCIISGIRPQIAQTIVHLGVDLQDVTTKATMADAFRLALRRDGVAFTRATKNREKVA